MIKKTIASFLMFIFLTGSVFADCTYNGATYAEGTRIGPYVCSGGQWVNG